ncbi:hypothetical protein IQ235_05435 [Oscillatoriales cyanobacterium LEGE 11467]|uniref:Uncharacterized protein n=1 Tax=Zarconia navalis LEGE 11467 TaxID=1828826 RepID=A0A928VTU1_9CYAN|nr:hypothetical protein [Zarconia navalis]MBE9040234.1 hypothetical protein [Zarconia navalis LEGE 11467]
MESIERLGLAESLVAERLTREWACLFFYQHNSFESEAASCDAPGIGSEEMALHLARYLRFGVESRP